MRTLTIHCPGNGSLGQRHVEKNWKTKTQLLLWKLAQIAPLLELLEQVPFLPKLQSFLKLSCMRSGLKSVNKLRIHPVGYLSPLLRLGEFQHLRDIRHHATTPISHAQHTHYFHTIEIELRTAVLFVTIDECLQKPIYVL